MTKLLLLVAMITLIGMFVSGGYAQAGSDTKQANKNAVTLNFAAINPWTGFEQWV